MIFDADLALTLPFLTGFLWALGGTGEKLIRRIGVPLSISLYCLAYGTPLWVASILALCLAPFITLSYGDDLEALTGIWYYPTVSLVSASWIISQFVLAIYYNAWLLLTICAIISWLVFPTLMFISKKLKFPWKIVEGITGFIVGLFAALVL